MNPSMFLSSSRNIQSLENPLHGESHLIRFSPGYYLAKNQDVKNANVDPWRHYQNYGWKEGRNPSPLFSTSFYVKQTNFLPDIYKDPLTHYLLEGRNQGARPHPLFDDVETRNLHVGIVTVAYNCSEIAMLTVRGVANAKADVNITYFLIDGGSEDGEKNKLRDFCAHFKSDKLSIQFIDLKQNRGFSASNNIGISKALANECTHICLLNPDVVVADYWLERMISYGEPFVSPVSNSVGNEQTVPCDYQIERSSTCFAIVNEFARKWALCFEEANKPSDFVGFFCALFKREVVDAVGFLDERFFPGGYDDLDYCIRVRQVGIDLSVSRHVYLHHWGSSSFSQLPMAERLKHTEINRKRFEEKHGTFWIDWKPTIIRSAIDDFRRVRPNLSSELRNFQQQMLERHQKACEELIIELKNDSLGAVKVLDQKNKDISLAKGAISSAEAQRDELANILQNLDSSYTVPPRLISPNSFETVTCQTPIRRKTPLKDDIVNYVEQNYSELFYLIAGELVLNGTPHFWAMDLLLPAITKLAEFLLERPVIVLANGADPIEVDERDGYSQRLLAIDRFMECRSRLYIRLSPNSSDGYRITSHSKGLAVLDLCSNDPVYIALLSGVMKFGRLIYIHSVVPLGDLRIRNAVANASGVKVIDVHGAVPEEFLMHNDRINSVLFDSYESEIVRQADFVVCVSDEMRKHLTGKHAASLDKFILCPIFSVKPKTKPVTPTARRPRVIYAGGTQVWQKIPEMAHAIAAIRDRADYVVLSPDPERIRHHLRGAGIPDLEAQRKVFSASHARVSREYRSAQYGFLLRSDSVINRVSCPTKLIEYLAFGIVPILESANIGDFLTLGMQFLSLRDVVEAGFPSEFDRRKMVDRNLKVVHDLTRQSESGLVQIKTLINESL